MPRLRRHGHVLLAFSEVVVVVVVLFPQEAGVRGEDIAANSRNQRQKKKKNTPPRLALSHLISVILRNVLTAPRGSRVATEYRPVVRRGLHGLVEVGEGSVLIAVHLPHQLGVLRHDLAVAGIRQHGARVVLLRPPRVALHLIDHPVMIAIKIYESTSLREPLITRCFTALYQVCRA